MKQILSSFLCLLSLCSFSQMKIGIQAGYNHSDFSKNGIAPPGAFYYHTAFISTFNAGIVASVPLVSRLFLQPSLLLSEKGTKEMSLGGDFIASNTTTHLQLFYAHLPAQVMYIIINNTQWQIAAGAGAFISKGIWGSSKGLANYGFYDSIGHPSTAKIDDKVNFTNSQNNNKPNTRNVKSWDAGYTVAAEATWQNLQLKAAYDFGLTKLVETKNRTRVLSISAGYYFIRKKDKRMKKTTAGYFPSTNSN